MELTLDANDVKQISCPLASDLVELLHRELPDVLERAADVLKEEGIVIPPRSQHEAISSTSDREPESPQQPSTPPVVILHQTKDYVVVSKPHGVVCHNSPFHNQLTNHKHKHNQHPITTGVSTRTNRIAVVAVPPMLQRVRDATGRKVNLIHRLDKGASGCLLLAFCEGDDDTSSNNNTNQLIRAMQNKDSIKYTHDSSATTTNTNGNTHAVKTYLAIVVGECDGYAKRGWITLDTPIKDEYGRIKPNAVTNLLFCGTIPSSALGPNSKTSLGVVICRPQTGNYHQIRQHLKHLKKPIVGDSQHGFNRANRELKAGGWLGVGNGVGIRNGLGADTPGPTTESNSRILLHLSRLQIPPVRTVDRQGDGNTHEHNCCPDGMDVHCPLPDDMKNVLDLLTNEHTSLPNTESSHDISPATNTMERKHPILQRMQDEGIRI
eukprot:CAMPEP_0194425196 /NCGR_PEP_ID=MMETSP0176-20130528/24533_1 /TAXON_ID=216777 /ORGANISM="Proboscia alata, Strain PI-D3" /LENGTH=435 /DNA_ID=CAMNT_0039235435 /DNA_START=146 /DNA_END=1453 /DNA_ORIENTATION=+